MDQMSNELTMLKEMMEQAIASTISEQKVMMKEWFSLKEAAKYIGVSVNTLTKYREMGLKVFSVEGVSRVSKKELERFLETYSN